MFERRAITLRMVFSVHSMEQEGENTMFQGVLLVVALSLDSFLTSLAYALRHISIPLKSAMVIAGISAGFLALSFALSTQFIQYLSPWIASFCSALVFAVLSVYSFFQSAIKGILKKNRQGITLRYGSIQIVLDIYLDEEKADQDHSKTLSVKEAIYLAVTLSFDSLFSGLALGFTLTYPFMIVCLDFLIALFSIYLPALCTRRFIAECSFDFGWLSAILFALLCILQLV